MTLASNSQVESFENDADTKKFAPITFLRVLRTERIIKADWQRLSRRQIDIWDPPGVLCR